MWLPRIGRQNETIIAHALDWLLLDVWDFSWSNFACTPKIVFWCSFNLFLKFDFLDINFNCTLKFDFNFIIEIWFFFHTRYGRKIPLFFEQKNSLGPPSFDFLENQAKFYSKKSGIFLPLLVILTMPWNFIFLTTNIHPNDFFRVTHKILYFRAVNSRF